MSRPKLDCMLGLCALVECSQPVFDRTPHVRFTDGEVMHMECVEFFQEARRAGVKLALHPRRI